MTASHRSRTSVSSRTYCCGSGCGRARVSMAGAYRVLGLRPIGVAGLAPVALPRHMSRLRPSAAMHLEAPIAVERLVKVYKTETAVDGITFTLKPGTVTALLGGNGAGKTTTIAMIMGLVIPTSGTVTVLGVNMARHRHRILHRMNFESPYVDMPMRLTVRQNLTIFGRLYGVEDLGSSITSIAEELNLTELLDRPTGKLSAGQKTRVSLAKSLIN